MKTITSIDLKAWYKTLNYQYMPFSLVEKKQIMAKMRKINETEAMEAQCLYFRQVLEMLVTCLANSVVSAETVREKRLNEKIELVSEHITSFNGIKREFHVVRAITNGYIHGRNHNPKADKKTLFFIMTKIQKWFANYAKFLQIEAEKNRKKSLYDSVCNSTSEKLLLWGISVVIIVGLGYFALVKMIK